MMGTVSSITSRVDHLSQADAERIIARAREENLDLNSLGVPHWIQESFCSLLKDYAVGLPEPPPPGANAPARFAADLPAAALLCSKIFVHDSAALSALGENGFVDGHVMFIPISTLLEKSSDPEILAHWLRAGALACAHGALRVPDESVSWPVVDQEKVRSVFDGMGVLERLVPDAWSPDTEQDAWRYASALACAQGFDEDTSALGMSARQAQAVELSSGWANNEWSPWVTLAASTQGWLWHQSNKAGAPAIGKLAGQVMDGIVERPCARRAFTYLLQRFGRVVVGGEETASVQGVLNALVQHPLCTPQHRADAISASAQALTSSTSVDKENLAQRLVIEDKMAIMLDVATRLHAPRAHLDESLVPLALQALSSRQCLDTDVLGAPAYDRLVSDLLRSGRLGVSGLGFLVRYNPQALKTALAHAPHLLSESSLSDQGPLFTDLMESDIEQWSDDAGMEEVVAVVRQLLEAGAADQECSPLAQGEAAMGWLDLFLMMDPEVSDESEVRLGHALLEICLEVCGQRQPGFATMLLEHAAGCSDLSPEIVSKLLKSGADPCAPLSFSIEEWEMPDGSTILDLSSANQDLGVAARNLILRSGRSSEQDNVRRLVRRRAL